MPPPNNIAHHLQYPEISVSEHRDALRKALHDSIKDKTEIYLDTNYWVYLKDFVLGKKSEPVFAELYELCTSMADSGRFFFPISQSTVEEILTQDDDSSRFKTAEIVDRLSNGISLTSIKERFCSEMVNFFDSTQTHALPHSSIWTKASTALATTDVPNDPRLDAKTNLACKKAFDDHRWNQSFSDFLLDAKKHGMQQVDVSAAYHYLNLVKKEHADDGESFNQMVVIEVQMALEVYRPDLPEVVKKVCATNGIPLSEVTDEYTSKIFNIVCEAFHQEKCIGKIPTLEIMSKLVAAVRWNATQEYKENDLRDFEHATGALPYCDLMLTEKGLTHLCTQKLLRLDEIYNCAVAWKPKDAVKRLKAISQS